MPLLAKPMPAAWLYEGGMALNYQYASDQQLKTNIKISEMDLRQPGDFLAKTTGRDAPVWLDVVLPEGVDGSQTYVASSVVLLGFGLFFLGLAAIDVRKDFRNPSVVRGTAKASLVLGLLALVLLPESNSDAKAAQSSGVQFVLSPTGMAGNEAQAFCARRNRSLAEASHVAELFNSNRDFAKTVYWTGNNYRGRSDVLWALNLSNVSRPVQETNILMNSRIATAYPVTDFRAIAVCVEPPETGK